MSETGPATAEPNGEPVYLWGSSGAGKTSFLAALLQPERGPGGAGLRPRWFIRPMDCASTAVYDYLAAARRNLEQGTAEPTPPASVGIYPDLSVRLGQWLGSRRLDHLPVSFTDPAGKFSQQPGTLYEPQGAGHRERLGHARGIIWLFEAGVPVDRLALLQQLVAVAESGAGERISVPVALCLSKIDTLPEEDRRAARDDADRALEEHLGPSVYNWFRTLCADRRCFAISARGVDPPPGAIDPLGLGHVLGWLAGRIRAREAAERSTGAGSAALRLVRGVGQRAGRALVAAITVVLLATSGWIWGPTVVAWGAGVFGRQAHERTALQALDRAGHAYHAQAYDSTIALLWRDSLPTGHARRLEWDTLLVLAFASEPPGRPGRRLGAAADSLYGVIERRAGDLAAGRRVAEPRRLALVRYAHARVCLVRACDEERIRDDLDYVVGHAADPDVVRIARHLRRRL